MSRKNLIGLLHIACDLRAQGFARIEPPLIAQPVKKLQARRHPSAAVTRGERTKVSIVEVVFAEGRTHTDVRDAIDVRALRPAPCVKHRRHGRDQFIFGFKVQRGNRPLAASPRAADDSSFDFDPATKKPACARDGARGDALPNRRAAGDHAAHGNRGTSITSNRSCHCFKVPTVPLAR